MKREEMVLDPDMEVIKMVNGAADTRQREKQNRELLRKIANEQKQSRKAKWWREFRSMAFETGTFAVASIAVLFAMGQSLVDPRVGVPVYFLCLAFAGIRVDRFMRR